MREWKKNRTRYNYETYKDARNEYYREIRRAKRGKWTEFLEMNKSENVFVALRYCKVRKYRRTETLTYEDKSAITFDEKAAMLKKVLFPKMKIQSRYNEIQEQRQTIIFHTVTNGEIKNAIFTSNVKKAAGPDNINFLCL